MNTKTKTRTSEAEERQFWQMVLEAYQASGLTVKQFCQNEGLAEWSFYHWKKKLRSAAANPSCRPPSKGDSPPPVDLARPSFLQIGGWSSSQAELRIAFPAGIQLQIPPGCDKQLLHEALAVLWECLCSGSHPQ